ncbi:phage baseplate assembly protein V [Neokomagataea anthophila]|uniref:Phage baseplate assembly protein V n=1 Tax=Neokomagataea anthophila TaxID=2826925 RepID=A0ABS5E8X3_9PROT|nr:phage baseplate assembly protein V [Neokomagataea anthophila]MBR0560331.1 phage baseplate assembly protein V [Neokomagataea anthophila]
MNDISLLAAAQMNRMAHAVFGIVSAVDPTNHAIKVRVQPENIETGWMPDVSGVQSGDLKIACPSSIGTHVVLLPIEGDAEQFIAVGALFDAVVSPPRVPGLNRVVQTGEWFMQAGGENSLGASIFVSDDSLKMNVGNSGFSIKNNEVIISVDGVVLSVNSEGVQVQGGDIRTESFSLNNHCHFVGAQKSTGPTL